MAFNGDDKMAIVLFSPQMMQDQSQCTDVLVYTMHNSTFYVMLSFSMQRREVIAFNKSAR